MSLTNTTAAGGVPIHGLRAWQAAALPLALDNLAAQLAGTAEPGLIAACTGAGKSRLIGEILAARVPRLLADEVAVITTPTQRLVRQLSATARQHLGEPVDCHYARRKWRTARVIVCCNASAPGLAARLTAEGKRIGLWVADEAHRTETPEIHRFAEAAPAVTALAVTATPYRAEAAESLRLWSDLLYRYSPSEALADGVLVPWRAVPWTGDADTEIDPAALAMIREHLADGLAGPGTVNALSCDDAEQFAAQLAAEGIAARPIHSRLTDREQDHRIEQLRRGQIGVLVYPSLLSEGVDFPWLRWGCLRRPVKSRVRFIQELGRFLRTTPGKSEAVILDPLGLLEQHATRVDAALGWIPDAEQPEPLEVDDLEDLDPADDEYEIEPRRIVARVADALGAYARTLLYLAIADGQIDPALAPQGGAWRRRPASDKQARYLGVLANQDRNLDPEHAAPIRAAAAAGLIPSCGAAGDLITLLKGLAEPWTPGARLRPLSAEALKAAAVAVQSEPIYVAAAQRGGVVALAAVRAGQVLASKARAVGVGVNPLAAEIAAVRFGAVAAVRARAPQPMVVATSSRPAADRIKNRSRAGHPQIHAALVQYHAAGITHDLKILMKSDDNPAQSAAWAAVHRAARGQK